MAEDAKSVDEVEGGYVKFKQMRRLTPTEFRDDNDDGKIQAVMVQPPGARQTMLPPASEHQSPEAKRRSMQEADPSQQAPSKKRKKKRRKSKSGKGTDTDMTESGTDRSSPKKRPKGWSKRLKSDRVSVRDQASTSLWVTADLSRDIDHEAYVIYALRDMCFYLIFISLISIFTFGVMDSAYNYYASVLSTVLTTTRFNTSIGGQRTFYQIATVDHFWKFMDGVFIPLLFENNYDEARSLKLVKPNSVMVLYENILVGAPRVRQVKTRNDSCKNPLIFKDLFLTCHDYWSASAEDTNRFGAGSAWSYESSDITGSPSFVGKISTYGGGGYSHNMSKDSRYTGNWIQELQREDWIRPGTRAVFVDFTTYTPNTNLFCVVKLLFEIPPCGGVIPSAYFHTMKYVGIWDYFVLACEMVFIGFVIFYTIEECMEISILRWKYFDSFWNWMDLAILFVSYFTIITGIVRFVVISINMPEKVEHINTDTHANFENFVTVQVIFNTSVAVLSFLAWIKALKYAALIRSVALVLSLFVKVWAELLTLLLMLAILLMGFSLLGHTIFGANVQEFFTFKDSLFTLIGLFVGGLNFYRECENIRPYMSPIYFTVYIFIVLVLFLNCFIALIVHGFYIAYEDFEDQRDRVYLADVLKRFRYNFLRSIKKYEYAEQLRLKEKAARNRKTYEALVNILRRHGFRGLSLGLLLKNYNINPGEPISFDTMDDIYKDINSRNQLCKKKNLIAFNVKNLDLEVEEHDKLMEEMERVNEKIEYLDQTLADVITKVNVLVDKFIIQDIKAEGRRS